MFSEYGPILKIPQLMRQQWKRLARINEELFSSNKKITNQVYPFSEILMNKPVHYILVRCESVSLIYM